MSEERQIPSDDSMPDFISKFTTQVNKYQIKSDNELSDVI